MKRKHRRLAFVVTGMVLLGAAAALVLSAFEENLVFFYSPSDLAAKSIPDGRRFRVGGLVEEGSVKRLADGLTVEFVVTDLVEAVLVSYRGPLPDLFREGQGVIAEGDGDEQQLGGARRPRQRHPGGVAAVRADHRQRALHQGHQQRQNQRVMSDLGDHCAPFHWPDFLSASATSGGM